MKNKQGMTGFTLIELLFVVAIIAVLAVMGLAAYTQKVMNVKMDKCTLQIQLWLQAGMSYYVDHNTWPASVDDLIDNGYVPNCTSKDTCSILTNPWGSDYNVEVDPSNNKLLMLLTDINPPDYILKNSKEIAQMIAGRLAGATSLNGENQPSSWVKVEINQPAQSNHGNTIIESIQIVDSGTIINQPVCPTNMTPQLYVSLAGFTPYNRPDNQEPSQPYFESIIQVDSCSSDTYPANPQSQTSNPTVPYQQYVCNDASNYNPSVWKPTILVWNTTSYKTQISRGVGRLLAITACVSLAPTNSNKLADASGAKYLF